MMASASSPICEAFDRPDDALPDAGEGMCCAYGSALAGLFWCLGINDPDTRGRWMAWEPLEPTESDSADEADAGGPFNPDWASPPGETLADILEDQGTSIADFATRMGWTKEQANDLIAGRTPIDKALARKLGLFVITSDEFWLDRERHYRAGLARRDRASIRAASASREKQPHIMWTQGETERLLAALKPYEGRRIPWSAWEEIAASLSTTVSRCKSRMNCIHKREKRAKEVRHER